MPVDLKRIWSGVGRARPPTPSLPAAVSVADVDLPPVLGGLGRSRSQHAARARRALGAPHPGARRAFESPSLRGGGGSPRLHDLHAGTPRPAGKRTWSQWLLQPGRGSLPLPALSRQRQARVERGPSSARGAWTLAQKAAADPSPARVSCGEQSER